MDIKVVDIKGKETSTKVTLADSIYSIEPNDHAIYLDVKQYLAAQRQGTQIEKEERYCWKYAELKSKRNWYSSCRSIKSPVFRGGGRVFGKKASAISN